eukprot:scaffold8608_cov124-Isochrysis_galbana.AAC.1
MAGGIAGGRGAEMDVGPAAGRLRPAAGGQQWRLPWRRRRGQVVNGKCWSCRWWCICNVWVCVMLPGCIWPACPVPVCALAFDCGGTLKKLYYKFRNLSAVARPCART